MFFMRIEILSFLFLFACMRFVLFVRMKSSCKRKIKRFKITLIPSFTILLTCNPLNVPIKNLFVRTYFCLWESFFFMISCKTFFINLLQYFTTASKNKLKILKAITLPIFYLCLLILIFFLSFKVYFRLRAFTNQNDR